MPRPGEHAAPDRPLSVGEAHELAETLKALASPVRLRLIAALLDGERTVEALAQSVGQSLSAVSHNLRILRTLRLVSARKDGRHVRYRLHDHHIAQLLAAIRHHHEHVHPRSADELRAGGRTSV